MASLLRQAARRSGSQLRFLSTSTVSRKDFVQGLYINELRAYKPPPTAKDAHLANVKQFSPPSPPQPPSSPSDLAAELAAYDAQEPDVTQPTPAKPITEASVDGGAAEFLAHLEADVPRDVHH